MRSGTKYRSRSPASKSPAGIRWKNGRRPVQRAVVRAQGKHTKSSSGPREPAPRGCDEPRGTRMDDTGERSGRPHLLQAMGWHCGRQTRTATIANQTRYPLRLLLAERRKNATIVVSPRRRGARGGGNSPPGRSRDGDARVRRFQGRKHTRDSDSHEHLQRLRPTRPRDGWWSMRGMT